MSSRFDRVYGFGLGFFELVQFSSTFFQPPFFEGFASLGVGHRFFELHVLHIEQVKNIKTVHQFTHDGPGLPILDGPEHGAEFDPILF